MAEDIKKIFLFSDELPPAGPGNTHSLRYRIVSEDGLQTSAWSPTYTVSGQTFSNVTGTLAGVSTTIFQGTWDDEFNRPQYDVFVAFGLPIAYRSLTNNVVTIQTGVPHGFKVGDIVNVAGSVAGVNKVNAVITAVPNTISLQYANTSANVANAVGGTTATVYGSDDAPLASSNYVYHGSPNVHSYSFVSGPDVANATTKDDYYYSAQILVQVAGINKELDSTLQIFKSPRVARPTV